MSRGGPGGEQPVTPRTAGLVDAGGEWSGLRVVVAGLGTSGFAAADALAQRGARVLVVDARDGDDEREKARVLDVMDVRAALGADAPSSLPEVDGAAPDLVVTSPGWRPGAPLLASAAAAGVPVWGDVELAWRLRPPAGAPGRAPWLAVTGTNGKTTTTRMLAAMLSAAGLRTAAVGNVGVPVLHAVVDPQPYDVLAVELSSYQLHWSSSIAAQSAAVLNLAPDHLDWHGGMDAYAAAKGRIYEGVKRACVYTVADPATEALVREADVVEGARAVGVTLGVPSVGMLGVVEDVLADRAFVAGRADSAAELGTLEDLVGASGGTGPAPHVVQDALAAAALARSHGVPPAAVRSALRGYRPDAHRIALVGEADGVRWVDDSKATNPHAASASLAAYDPVVWVAGGLPKGATFDELVARHARRLRGVVLVGLDRGPLLGALRRHAPEVPVLEVDASQDRPVGGADDGQRAGEQQAGGPQGGGRATGRVVMERAVALAGRLARPGDVVLLAPACASMDQFTDYGARGDAFAAAVRAALAGRA
ncbi:UDP-N-acetylmuramoyl-L-alanine--D-glutamate ligase [Pseudokineococcus basanitobsidens]|uniref:UDP-N-acetylmuramoylalanine--D-glutamate ligase n=1 Tax=Pseudokineococcus basanitobsidens TaxID=1926649 RepID=A0ABU8RHD4_9ACTN